MIGRAWRYIAEPIPVTRGVVWFALAVLGLNALADFTEWLLKVHAVEHVMGFIYGR